MLNWYTPDAYSYIYIYAVFRSLKLAVTNDRTYWSFEGAHNCQCKAEIKCIFSNFFFLRDDLAILYLVLNHIGASYMCEYIFLSKTFPKLPFVE